MLNQSMQIELVNPKQPHPAMLQAILRSRHPGKRAKVDNTIGTDLIDVIRNNALCEYHDDLLAMRCR
jgi:hypothetical protein